MFRYKIGKAAIMKLLGGLVYLTVYREYVTGGAGVWGLMTDLREKT